MSLSPGTVDSSASCDTVSLLFLLHRLRDNSAIHISRLAKSVWSDTAMVRRRSSPMGESKLGDARQQPADAQHDRRCTAWPRHDSSCEIGVISAEKTRRVGAATMTTTILADGRHGTFHFDVDDAALAIGSGDGAEAASWRRWWFVVVDGADFIHGPPAAAP